MLMSHNDKNTLYKIKIKKKLYKKNQRKKKKKKPREWLAF